jgi:type II secretory pathway pseudopilin PulG
MKAPSPAIAARRGATLIEAVIAIGVLAVAIPLTFGTMAEAGRGKQAAVAETRSTWIVPACIAEIQAVRSGRPAYFDRIPAGQPFPPAGEVWALGFADDGQALGKISKADYDKGLRQLGGRTPRYIATLSATAPAPTDESGLFKVRVTLEHPASAPAKKRQSLDFHTRIP